jgi:hypothetical protein
MIALKREKIKGKKTEGCVLKVVVQITDKSEQRTKQDPFLGFVLC